MDDEYGVRCGRGGLIIVLALVVGCVSSPPGGELADDALTQLENPSGQRILGPGLRPRIGASHREPHGEVSVEIERIYTPTSWNVPAVTLRVTTTNRGDTPIVVWKSGTAIECVAEIRRFDDDEPIPRRYTCGAKFVGPHVADDFTILQPGHNSVGNVALMFHDFREASHGSTWLWINGGYWANVYRGHRYAIRLRRTTDDFGAVWNYVPEGFGLLRVAPPGTERMPIAEYFGCKPWTGEAVSNEIVVTIPREIVAR